MNLIVIGLFAVNDSGLSGALLQMVTHGLISAALFLLAGAVERRAATGDLGRLGGMARGRPILATTLITTGVIALAVPGSSAFAGEFLILNGIFTRGWGWAVVGRDRDRARRHVHAAADLGRPPPGSGPGRHRRGARPPPGRDQRDRPARRRPARRSRFWPAAITDHSFGGRPADSRRAPGSRRRRDEVPDAVDRLGRALAGADPSRRRGGLPARRRSSCRTAGARHFCAVVSILSFVGAGAAAIALFQMDETGHGHRRGRDQPRPPRRARAGARHRLGPPRGRRLLRVRPATSGCGEYYTLLLAAAAGHVLLRRRQQPDDDVPRARVVLDLALHPLRDRDRASLRRSRRVSST